MAKMTRLDYCQYLLRTQINYTLTHFASHTQRFRHNKINRYLAGAKNTPARSGIMLYPTSYKPKTDMSSLTTRLLTNDTRKTLNSQSRNTAGMRSV